MAIIAWSHRVRIRVRVRVRVRVSIRLGPIKRTLNRIYAYDSK